MRVYSTRADVSIRLCSLLGRACVEFSMLEMYLDRTIYLLRRQDRKVGRAQLTRKMFAGRLKIMVDAAERRFGAQHQHAEHYRRVSTALMAVCQTRNTFVHGLWSRGTTKGTRRKWYVLSYFVDPRGLVEEVSAKDLEGLRKMIRISAQMLEDAAVSTMGASLLKV